MRHKFFITITILFGISLSPQLSLAENSTVKNLEDVFNRVRENNAELASLELKLDGLAALSNQAKQIPNPQLTFETENFSGDRDGFTETENTISISQKIELGGKRSARARTASTNELLNRAKTELRMCDLLKEVQTTYADVLLSQAQLSLAREQVAFSKKILISVREKVKLGGSLKREQTKAEISLSLAKLDVKKLESELVQKKLKLISFWHGTLADVKQLSELENLETPPGLENIDSFPVLRVETLRIKASENSFENQKALSIPDVTVRGGYRRFEDTNEDAFIAGFSVPLNLFNRNKGAIENASNSLEATRVQHQGKKSELTNRLESLKKRRLILLEEQKSLNKNLLPSSRSALTQIRDAYQLGRVGYLDLSDSWRLYFDTRSRAAQNSHSIQINQAEISSLTGQILNRLSGDNSNE